MNFSGNRPVLATEKTRSVSPCNIQARDFAVRRHDVSSDIQISRWPMAFLMETGTVLRK
ncbi:hypothetical protein SXCC_02887 [Gluconacetobacter sp. SXCC-1]|nr:hypothetical protein SXCC_02887 [Gluconacetobacter sp. SXCC-1]